MSARAALRRLRARKPEIRWDFFTIPEQIRIMNDCCPFSGKPVPREPTTQCSRCDGCGDPQGDDVDSCSKCDGFGVVALE